MRNWAALAVILLVVAVFFAKTIFLGMPISKIARLPEWDSLYSAYWTGRGGLCDPSIVQLLVPGYFLVADIWRSGQIPLWNSFSGFGVPLAGDIQATIFSPVRFMFTLFPSMYTYNLTLVLEVALSGLGTCLVARALCLSRWASLFAALAYALCPYNLFYLEQLSGASHCLFPGLLWLFARLAACPGPGRAAWAGAGCACLLLSGHPESSLFDVMAGSLLYAALVLTARDGGMSFWRRASAMVQYLFLAGVVAFALSAPSLLPFAEYLANADCYKFAVGQSAYIPWQAVAYDLVQPGFGPASPYPGVAVALLLPLGLIAAARGHRVAAIVSVLALSAVCLISRLGPLETLLLSRPFNYVVTVYCMPVFLLCVVLLAAIAFDRVTSARGWSRMDALGFALAAVLIGFVPPVLKASSVDLSIGDFDQMIPHMQVNFVSWQRDLVLTVVLSVVILCAQRWRRCPAWLMPSALTAVCWVSLAYNARGSLPVQNRFDYPVVEPITLLRAKHARFVALGEHLFKPNTGAVYGVNDIRTHNPLFPRGYLTFMEASGANIDLFNQVYPGYDHDGSRLLNMAGVGYVLALQEDVLHARLDANPSLKKVMTTDPQNIDVYECSNASPRAHFVDGWVPVSSPAEAMAKVRELSFDPMKVVVLEGASVAARSPTGAAAKSAARIDRERCGLVSVKVSAQTSGYLVLADTFYPGWRAVVDGNEVAILRANYLFRAVALPPGEHTVVFEYRPQSFWAGLALAAICLVALAAGYLLAGWRSRRSTSGMEQLSREEICR